MHCKLWCRSLGIIEIICLHNACVVNASLCEKHTKRVLILNFSACSTLANLPSTKFLSLERCVTSGICLESLEGSSMSDAEKLEALLKPVKASFRASLKQSLPSFIEFKQDLAENKIITPKAYGVIKSQCHKIAGSSKTLGFKDLGRAAADVEKCLGAIDMSENGHVTVNGLSKSFDNFLLNVRAAI